MNAKYFSSPSKYYVMVFTAITRLFSTHSVYASASVSLATFLLVSLVRGERLGLQGIGLMPTA